MSKKVLRISMLSGYVETYLIFVACSIMLKSNMSLRWAFLFAAASNPCICFVAFLPYLEMNIQQRQSYTCFC